MLTNLHVKNIVLIDEVEVDFERGLNILTGKREPGNPFFLVRSIWRLEKMASDSIGKFGDSALVELILPSKIQESRRNCRSFP